MMTNSTCEILQHMAVITLSSQESAVFFPTSGSSVQRKRGRPHRGYTSRHSTPFPFRKLNVTFKRTATTSTKCSIPSGMRILDVGILAEAMTNLTCSTCNSHLALYESEYLHGWHTTFYIKCVSCQQLF